MIKKPNLNIKAWIGSMSDIYNLKDENAKGRLISLGSGIMSSLYNVFITGIFYTGFLSMYDMSITSVGIISFIPLIASLFCIFSSKVLSHFKRRKPILIASKVLFYFLYIVATNLMPLVVKGATARLVCFSIILFVAYGMYALFSPGFTPWFYAFYPNDNEKRMRYIALNQTICNVAASLVLLLSGPLTDAVSNSPHQKTFILGMRYLAFLMVIADVWMQARAVERPLPESEKISLKDIFTLPFHYKKFMLCIGMMFYWNFVANITNGVWSYHLLNHMNFSYTLINIMSVAYTVILVCTQKFWHRMLRRYSWIKTFGLAVLMWVPTEFAFFFMTSTTKFLYVPLCLIQNFLSIGLNFSYANVLYINLPEENSTAHIAFYSVGVNLFAFFGLLLGTYVSSIGGDTPLNLFGMEIYTVQFNTILRGVTMLALGLFLTYKWRLFTPQSDIEAIEAFEQADRKMRLIPRQVRKGRLRLFKKAR